MIQEIKKAAKDPTKTIEQIINDPKNAKKIVGKALKPIIEKVKEFQPFKLIKVHLKELEDFMEKHKIPIKEAKKFLKDKPLKAFK